MRGLSVPTAQPRLGCLMCLLSLETFLHVAKDAQIKSDSGVWDGTFMRGLTVTARLRASGDGSFFKSFCHRQFLPSPQHVNLFHLLNGKVNAVTFKKKKVYSILLSNYLQFRGNEKGFFGFYVYDHETYHHMFLFFST